MSSCPGFGQDRVNLSPEARRGHSRGGADPTWPNRTGYLIPCAVTQASRWGASQREVSRGSGAQGGTGWWELLCAFCCLFCIFSSSVLLLLLFASFTVLLNCPYSGPQIFCLFLSIPLPTPEGGWVTEQLRGPFVAGHSQTITLVSCVLVCGANWSVSQKDDSTPWVCITEHCSQWGCSKHGRAVPSIVRLSLDMDKLKCKMREVKGNHLRLKKFYPTGLVWRNWHVKVNLEIKILEGKKQTRKHSYTIQSCYGLAAAGNKSATRPPLPPPWCGGEWKETGRNRWVGIRAV